MSYGLELTSEQTDKVFQLDEGSPDLYLGRVGPYSGSSSYNHTVSYPDLVGKVVEIYAVWNSGSGFNFNNRISQSYVGSTASLTLSSTGLHPDNRHYFDIFARLY